VQISTNALTQAAAHRSVRTLKVASDADVTPATSWKRILGYVVPLVLFLCLCVFCVLDISLCLKLSVHAALLRSY